MIELNGNSYRLCLLDTNVVSEMIKHAENEFKAFVSKYLGNKCIPCFSVFTILELRESRGLLERFMDYFSILPCAILKSHEQLLDDEVGAYDTGSPINPILFAATPIQEPSLRHVITETFSKLKTRRLATGWLDGRQDALNGMLSLKDNYPPRSTRYSRKEVSFFIFTTVTTQLGLRQRDFCRSALDEGREIGADRFPSVKTCSYTVFFKFYVDNRTPQRSDVFDILIASALPYVDVFLTERHQTEVVRRIKTYDDFIDHLEARSIRDLR